MTAKAKAGTAEAGTAKKAGAVRKEAAEKKALAAKAGTAKKAGAVRKDAAGKRAVPAKQEAPAKKDAPAAKATKASQSTKGPSSPATPVARASGKAARPSKAASPDKAATRGKKVAAPHKTAEKAAGGTNASKAAAGTATLEKRLAAPAPAREAAPARPGSNGGGLLSRRTKPIERRTEGYTDERWLAHRRHALEAERDTYVEQARSLRAEAESLVEEMEPGDIQFDDESGEGGTVTVDRERDLALSAQAMQAVDEIDHAFAKMATQTYGICENCGRLIPKPRLEALPFARLCIDCKSGGLSRR